jgi:predicted nucleic acid-binding protein
MIFVVDTSVLIDVLRGDARATSVLAGLAERGDEAWSVSIVRTEVLAGMRRGEETSTMTLLDALRWQDVTVEVADRAGQIARQYLKSHSGVDTVDYLIAAATQLLKAKLLTQNVKHFPMIPGLKPAY